VSSKVTSHHVAVTRLDHARPWRTQQFRHRPCDHLRERTAPLCSAHAPSPSQSILPGFARCPGTTSEPSRVLARVFVSADFGPHPGCAARAMAARREPDSGVAMSRDASTACRGSDAPAIPMSPNIATRSFRLGKLPTYRALSAIAMPPRCRKSPPRAFDPGSSAPRMFRGSPCRTDCDNGSRSRAGT